MLGPFLLAINSAVFWDHGFRVAAVSLGAWAIFWCGMIFARRADHLTALAARDAEIERLKDEVNNLQQSVDWWDSFRQRGEPGETFKHGCICPMPKKDANGKYDWKIREDCQYHASAAAQPSNHGIPWNCPTYWDGCNCASSLSKQTEEIAALRADAERWRYLRDSEECDYCVCEIVIEDSWGNGSYEPVLTDLDAAIDAAMRSNTASVRIEGMDVPGDALDAAMKSTDG